MNEMTAGPDWAKGIAVSAIADGSMITGHVGGEPVLLVRRGDEFFAIGAVCTHYGAPLADGLLVEDTVRSPWHHACFSLRTGEALRAPALDPVSCWRVEQRDGTVVVDSKLERGALPSPAARAAIPDSVVIVGGGAAGNSAAEMLRRLGYAGRITMLSADSSAPCDRPSLSKGFLSGATSEQSVPLRDTAFYQTQRIGLKLDARVAAIDTAARHVRLVDGTRYDYGALLLATGAEPVRLDVPGANLPHAHYLRTAADCRALVAKALTSKRASVGSCRLGIAKGSTSAETA